MELNLSKQAVNTSEVFYDAMTEQPLECDVLLPDYCPDIQKVLRCEVVLSLLSHAVNGENFSMDGMATAHVYYLDVNGCLRHAEYKIPYTKTLELRAAPQHPAVVVNQNVDYFNCRAVSQRRLDMRGAVSIALKVSGQNEEQVLCAAQGMGVQLRHETVENTLILPPVTRQTRIYEEVALAHGKPAVGSVLRYHATAHASEWKLAGGKLVTKGEATVQILYQCQEDEKAIERMEYSLPVTQMIDLSGLDEECICHCWYEACGLEVVPKRDVDGENKLFSIELTVNAMAGASKRVTFEAASDSYSTDYECRQAIKQVPFLELLEQVSETYMRKEALEMPCEIQSIVDLWCTTGLPTMRMEQDAAVVGGKLLIKLFACDTAGEIIYFEQVREFSERIALRKGCETVSFSPRIAVESVSYTVNSATQLEVRCGLRIEGELYNQHRRQVICDLSVDETRKKARRDNMLYLYYPDAQESVWEIAKRYNSPAEVIRRENGLEENNAGAAAMLLIPMQ